MKPLVTAHDDRIDTEISLIEIALHPDRIVGPAAELLPICGNPVIDDMVDPEIVAQFLDQRLQIILRFCSLQLRQSSVQIGSR